MTEATYEHYIEALTAYAAGVAHEHRVDTEVSRQLAVLRRLAGDSKVLLEKFSRVEGQLVNYVRSVAFDDNELDRIARLLVDLRELDNSLVRLSEQKDLPIGRAEQNKFVASVYNETSLSDIELSCKKVSEFRYNMENAALKARHKRNSRIGFVVFLILSAFLVYLALG